MFATARHQPGLSTILLGRVMRHLLLILLILLATPTLADQQTLAKQRVYETCIKYAESDADEWDRSALSAARPRVPF